MGFSDIMVIMPYGEWWRKNRKYFHRYFNIEITQTYKNTQLDKARQILPCIASSPENIVRLMRRAAVSTIVKTTFGFDIKDMNDSYVVIAEKVAKGFSQAGLWGSFYVDIITWLKYIPEWFPGAYFKRFAAEHKALLGRMRMEPFVKVQKAIENGIAKTSICASMIEQLPDELGPTRDEEVELAVNTTTIAYAGWSLHTTATLQWLILALLLNPEVQTKAHEELDRVVGHSRLPDFEDLSNLPYIQAIVKETLRWHPTVPLIDHSTTEDDEYKGNFIPKGTVVIANIWGLLHDPDTYPDPLKFKPERFLTPDGQLDLNVKDPSFAAFGFGRRICPGRFFAINTLNIIVASLLHVYTISPETDANGQVIPVKEEVESSAICPPKPFHCKAQARSAALEALVNQVEGVEE
ncbi:cytochrome P450 [Abortiporus biennis]|nr:cytochrome P450 [Abortiporus biennis]